MLDSASGFRIIDTTRFFTSYKTADDLYDYNLNMIMELIGFEYFKGLKGTKIEQIINDSSFLKSLRLKIYCDKDVESLQEVVNVLNK